jgi:hypothetical protein
MTVLLEIVVRIHHWQLTLNIIIMNATFRQSQEIDGQLLLVIVNNLEVSGNLTAGNKVTVKCTNFKFDSGLHDCPINFSIHIEVDGVCASRWCMTFEKEQKEFQDGWVRLINQLQKEQFNTEDKVRENASKLWEDFS